MSYAWLSWTNVQIQRSADNANTLKEALRTRAGREFCEALALVPRAVSNSGWLGCVGGVISSVTVKNILCLKKKKKWVVFF